MLIAIAFILFAAMIASWLFAPESTTESAPTTSMVPSGAAAD
jgi:FlaG/FlaF family flagellin (archaellin)